MSIDNASVSEKQKNKFENFLVNCTSAEKIFNLASRCLSHRLIAGGKAVNKKFIFIKILETVHSPFITGFESTLEPGNVLGRS